MIQSIHLKNFKSFTESTFNFMGKKNQPKQLIILYGANGSGKTNLVDVFYCLSCTFNTLNSQSFFMQLLNENLTADKHAQLDSVFNKYKISNIIEQNKTIGSTSNMRIDISFSLFKKSGMYSIEFDDTQIVYERLEYALEKNKGVYFEVSERKEKYSTHIFHDKFLSELKDLKRKYWGKHSVISLITYINDNYSDEFKENAYAESLSDVIAYLRSMTCHLVEHHTDRYNLGSFRNLLDPFEEGMIDESEKDKLANTQEVLNYFFTNLYHDIDGVYYKTILNDYQKTKYELYFRKNLSSDTIDVKYTKESCGTQSLLQLLPFFLAATYDVVVAIDEIDNGIHDILLSELMHRVIPLIKGQLIITTHNTAFLNDYDFRDYIYVIDVSNDFQKTIIPINDGNYRIQKTSNVIANYMKGQFGGIPQIKQEFDFGQIYKLIHQKN